MEYEKILLPTRQADPSIKEYRVGDRVVACVENLSARERWGI